ncbi:MAG: hypothetical protein R3B40_13920 [Polyangiales bacterium]|nr:hypothetical protein [Myxococcales bacterium]
MSLPAQHREGPVGRQLGGLLLSQVRHDNAMLSLRAAQWHRTLTRVGVEVPFWAVHDIGMLALLAPSDVLIEPRPALGALGLDQAQDAALKTLALTLREIGESEVMEKARQWRLEDPLISVLLLKVLAPLYERFSPPGTRREHAALPLDPEVYAALEPALVDLYRGADRASDLAFLEYLARANLRLVTAFEQIDLDTLRLVGMFGAGAGGGDTMLDLLGVFESPEANDVVNFSLDLLPSVLETKRASGSQSFSVDGYSGVQRRGTIDSLVLSELAFDPDLFVRRFVENEVFYYAREKEHDQERRLHYILVDASASMRGQRATFARGLALTLIKKFTLRGEDVYFRFFDSRLYDVQRTRPGRTDDHGGISVPYLLRFKGEHGRNYAKVFGLMVNELSRLERREGRTPMVYLLTHAECHVPVDTIENLRRVAKLYGIFMLPSTGKLELDYLQRLHTVQVVDEQALKLKDARAKRALDIVEDAARESLVPGAPHGGGSGHTTTVTGARGAGGGR